MIDNRVSAQQLLVVKTGVAYLTNMRINTYACGRYLITGGVVVAVGATITLSYNYRQQLGQYVKSVVHNFYTSCIVYSRSILLNICSSPIARDNRNLFRRLSYKSNPTSSKPLSNRTIIRDMFKLYSVLSGKENYYVSMSANESKSNNYGDHYYYFSKDLAHQSKVTKCDNNMTRVLIDVDYYMEMDKFLGKFDSLLYTIDPLELGGSNDSCSYTFVENEFHMYINGGIIYKHRLWDYTGDHIFQPTWYGGNLYNLEIKRLDNLRILVFINYRRTVYGPLAWLWFKDIGFKRKSVSDPVGFNHQKVIRPDGVIVHNISKQNCFYSVTLTDAQLNNILVRTKYSSQPQLSDVERIFRSQSADLPLDHAALVFDYIKCNGLLSNSISTTGFEDNYQTLVPLVYEDGKPTMRRICPPILDEGFSPAKSLNNDYACIKGRILDVKNQVLTYPGFYYTVVKEFLELTFPNAGSVIPGDFDSQWTQMDRPNQRSLINKFRNYMFYTVGTKVSSFQKREPYPKITDPRNISTLPINHNFRMGQFSIAIAQELKKHSWYAFGKHPKDFSNIIFEKARNSMFAVPSDISRMDGTGSKLWSDLVIAAINRCVHPNYLSEALGLFMTERTIKGYTNFGLDYMAEYGTLSGSGCTSWSNTLKAVYTVYLCFRTNGYSKEQAWHSLGVYGGDDGVTFDLDQKLLNNTFAKIGVLSKSERIEAGHPVPFLGRVYIDPWTSPKSFTDVPRQMKKFHLTCAPKTVPNHICLLRKATGYRITDPTTPIIREWTDKVLQWYGDLKSTEHYDRLTKNDLTYWTRFEHPFEPLTVSEQAIALNWIAEQLGCDAHEVAELAIKITKTKCPEDFEKFSFKTKEPIEIDACHRGVLKTAQKKDSHQAKIKS